MTESVAAPPVALAAEPATPPADDAELEALRQRAVEEHQQRVTAEARREEELARAGAERERAARAEAEQRRRLDEAVREVRITLYTTTWCPVCAQARGFLAANGLRFVDRDVETDPDARAIHRRLNPRGGVPTIDVDGQTLVGFAPRSLASAIEAAARRRLRR